MGTIKEMQQSSSTTTDTSASPDTTRSQDDLKDSKKLSLGEKAKKKNWYNVIYPSYKSRSDDFKKLFTIPDEERLLVGKLYKRHETETCVIQLRDEPKKSAIQKYLSRCEYTQAQCDNKFIYICFTFINPRKKRCREFKDNNDSFTHSVQYE